MSGCGPIQPGSCGLQPATLIGVSRIFIFNPFSNRLYEKALKTKMLRVQELRKNLVAGRNPQIGGWFAPAK
jgi:hypothetical protein